MKFSVVALFAAGALAMPAGNACSSSSSEYPPPSYPTPTTTSSYPYPTPNNGGGEYPPPPPPPPPAYTTSPPAYTTSPPNGGGWGNGGNGGNGGNNGGGNGGNGGGNGGNGGNNGGGHQFKCPSGLYSNPQCCALGILGLADLDCESPSQAPKDANDFRNICDRNGKEAQCCVLPVLGQGVLCQDAF